LSATAEENESHSAPTSGLALLGLSALGIVFGDIGTSPLYTFKTVLELTGGPPDATTVIGLLSLILWTLILITTVKYVSFAMRIDNDGEGGILALMSLLSEKLGRRSIVVTIGLLGAALIYGDGAITPAISVLSALEGLNIVAPSLKHYIVPASVCILVALFAFQPRGTAKIGQAFGPVMMLWFLTIGVLGIWGIAQHPLVLIALNPIYGMHYLLSGGRASFFVLGGVFLCVTGAEALYADMGHFGAKPIRLAWSLLVFPSLVLNYAGQAAIVIAGAPITDNIFFRLCPQTLLIPLVVLSTVATIIASQSIITGAFSMTRQAIQLGWLPRLQITQTSAEGYGQIYVGVINWTLMVVTVGLVIGFGKSDNLAAAYGIAVSATMLATSVLLFIAMRQVWKWNLLKAGSVACLFLIVDSSFFVANLSKVAEGGYVPLLFAAIVYSAMLIWHKGAQAVAIRRDAAAVPIDIFMAKIKEHNILRTPGTGVFLTRTQQHVPSAMVWHVKQNHVLNEQVFILTVDMRSIPWIRNKERLTFSKIAPNVWRAVARYGFMERPNIPNLLARAHKKGCEVKLDDVTYYVGRETIIPLNEKQALPLWMESIFAFMQRNALQAGEYYLLPSDRLVEIGRQVAI